MTKEEAIMVLKNEQPHCGKKALFPEEKKYEAYDVAIKALEQEPCEDCVRRQAVIDAINANCVFENEYNLTASRIQNAVEGLPSVTPQPKTGQWIKVTNGRGGHECDVCHDYAPSFKSGDEYLSTFCPNCGAKMVKPQESEDKE